MAQKSSENQATNVKSSKESDSIEATISEVEVALDSGKSVEEITGEQPQAEAAVEEDVEAAPQAAAPEAEAEEDDDEDIELPSAYKKEVRELIKKLPKGYEGLGKALAKRAKQVEKDRQQFYSDYQSKTAFAAKLSRAVEPYLDHWKAKGIIPEIGVERAAKLDYLIANDPQAAVKFIMQMANVRKASLDDDEVTRITEQRQDLTKDKPLTQDEVRRLAQEEYSRASQLNAATQQNLSSLENLVGQKANGKDKYPNLRDDDFVKSMEPLVASLLSNPANNLSFEQAVLAAYVSRGGVIEHGSAPQIPSRNKDNEKVERLKVASTIRPANSSSNSLNLDDIEIPDSIEETIALAERLTAGRT
jgi:hypothetical protein